MCRGLLSIILTAIVIAGLYILWNPIGVTKSSGYDRGKNGIWLAHGWFGADEWFVRYGKQDQIQRFREQASIHRLTENLSQQHIRDLFPHVAPADSYGNLPALDHSQVDQFLSSVQGMRVMPWVGGVIGKTVDPNSQEWRGTFIQSILALLERHPQLSGVHVNIEPWPTGNKVLLDLLKQIKSEIPAGKLLSVAAYPPTTLLHPFPSIHWDESYYKEVSVVVDQLVVMMYDTALQFNKLYQYLMKKWTIEVLTWSQGADVLLGVPAYSDAVVGYHNPSVENLDNALAGIQAGLSSFTDLPEHFQGVAIYSDWEMEPQEWRRWRTSYLGKADYP